MRKLSILELLLQRFSSSWVAEPGAGQKKRHRRRLSPVLNMHAHLISVLITALNQARLSFTKAHSFLVRVNLRVIENTPLINELRRGLPKSDVSSQTKANAGRNWGAFLVWVNKMKCRETEMSAGPSRTRSNETQHVFVKHAWKEYASAVHSEPSLFRANLIMWQNSIEMQIHTAALGLGENESHNGACVRF